MWFPANLVWDRFPFSLDLELEADTQHTVITSTINDFHPKARG